LYCVNKYSSNIRYPNELAPDEAIAKLAIAKARQVYDFCVSKRPEIEKNDGGELAKEYFNDQ
jgi:hypothetical protein